MKYYIIAGEASGDLHGSNLIKEIKLLDPKADFRCWGGDLMEAEGAKLVKHYRDLAFMGFVEVLANLPAIMRNFKLCKNDLVHYKPDALILIDYPGFNLRMAAFAKKLGFKVYYYISPQVWAWKQSRVKQIKEYVDRMFVILPFEKEFYKKFNYEVDFVGHPLLDAIAGLKTNKINLPDARPVIALLPGSRKQEISRILPLMLEVSKKYTGYRFVIAAAPSIADHFYSEISKGFDVDIVYNNTYTLLSEAKAALVTSGTATLETALFEVPEVVCYKGGSVSYQIAKRLIHVKYISLVNLVMDKEIVKELIQDELNVENLCNELNKLLNNKQLQLEMSKNYSILKEKLGGKGASAKTAALILTEMHKNGNC
jgi:lipid-A-disaccharide synthase